MGRGGTAGYEASLRNWRDDFRYKSYAEAVEIDERLESVSSVNLEQLAGLMFPDRSAMTTYAIERLLRSLNVYDSDAWYLSYDEDAYYGDKWSASLGHAADQIVAELERGFFDFTESEQIERTLELEFGFVLPELQGRHWQTEQVKLSEIDLAVAGGYRQLDTKVVAHYAFHQQRRELPLALVTAKADGEGFNLIDGAHRVAGALRNDPNGSIMVLRPARKSILTRDDV